MRESLEERLAGLSRDVVPSRNLWPAIAREISRRPRHSPWMAVAASTAFACVAAGLVWVGMHARPPATPGDAAAANIEASLREPEDPAYVAARTAVQETFRERLARLDPATRAQIEASLASIHKTRDDLRRALATEPGSPVLEQLLESAWHDEFDLYDDVIRTTQTPFARI
ncbi:MAG TPA: hypothetical protein VK437_12380 [Steroidobacteraceae bacterium]|nr:hypothetical protein [Steroidobacteraceae bacterium]